MFNVVFLFVFPRAGFPYSILSLFAFFLSLFGDWSAVVKGGHGTSRFSHINLKYYLDDHQKCVDTSSYLKI